MKTIAMAGILACGTLAQSPNEPAPLLQLIRKPAVAAPPARPYGEARAAVNVIGLTAVTGPRETWLMEWHESFASIEALDKAIAGLASRNTANGFPDSAGEDILPPSRTLIGVYRPDWSYRAEQAVRLLPAARYFHVSIYRIHPGGEAEFGETVRLRRFGMDKANLDRPDLAYQMISGAPSGTFVFLAPLSSLRMLDDVLAKMPLYFEATAGARKGAAEVEISREHLLLRVEPRISYVSDDFASADHAFWRSTPNQQ